MPAQPPSAWARRSTTRLSIEGASTQAIDATIYSAQPTSSGRLRPKRSAIGPYSACPNARPMKKIDSVSCADAVSV
jgi:hypothetical protein